MLPKATGNHRRLLPVGPFPQLARANPRHAELSTERNYRVTGAVLTPKMSFCTCRQRFVQPQGIALSGNRVAPGPNDILAPLNHVQAHAHSVPVKMTSRSRHVTSRALPVLPVSQSSSPHFAHHDPGKKAPSLLCSRPRQLTPTTPTPRNERLDRTSQWSDSPSRRSSCAGPGWPRCSRPRPTGTPTPPATGSSASSTTPPLPPPAHLREAAGDQLERIQRLELKRRNGSMG